MIASRLIKSTMRRHETAFIADPQRFRSSFDTWGPVAEFRHSTRRAENSITCHRNESKKTVAPSPIEGIIHVQGEQRERRRKDRTRDRYGSHCGSGMDGEGVDHVVGYR